jgi:signal peptide peptidase SppA
MNLELMSYIGDRNRLWAIDESFLLRCKASAEAHEGATMQARDAAPMSKNGVVAIIDVSGPISPRATVFSQAFGGASIDSLRGQFRQAMADDSVKSILFVYDTPGGEVTGVSDFAGEILAARGRKPILAQVAGCCASAGYWLASAADRIVSAKDGVTGSIGVLTMHADISGMLEQGGVKVTVISEGKYKTEASPYSALSDEAKSHIQDSMVRPAYDSFVGDVAAGRNVTPKQVEHGYGEGRVLTAKAAKSAGMIDAVGTFESTLVKMLRGGSVAGMRAEAEQPAAVVSETPPAPVEAEVDVPPVVAEAVPEVVAAAPATLSDERLRWSLR